MTSDGHTDNQTGKIVKAQTLSIQPLKSSVLVGRGLIELKKLVEIKKKNEIIIAGMEFVLVRGGKFEMGDLFNDVVDETEDDYSETIHTIRVSDFYLAKTTVTVAQYRVFCNATGREMPSVPRWGWKENHPIVIVSWNDANAFCSWAGCRLPTEAEWEYAAREGGRKVRFGNGKNIANPLEINFDGRIENKKDYSVAGLYRGETIPVGSFRSNSLGLYDMSGNVNEWCHAWYQKVKYPRGPASDSPRMIRGGCWESDPSSVRCSSRCWVHPDDAGYDLGFRPAR
jgi:formylglycine-generating enzyme